MTLPNFDTGNPVTMKLERKCRSKCPKSLKPSKTQTRSQCCGTTLAEVKVEIEYLEQVEAAIAQMDKYQTLEDLKRSKKSVRS